LYDKSNKPGKAHGLSGTGSDLLAQHACFASLLLESAGALPIRNCASGEFGLEKYWQSQHTVIMLNGVEQATKNDPQNPHTILIGKKAGKKLMAGDKLQVRNPNGSVSRELIFTGS
jgi:hypothetical protein